MPYEGLVIDYNQDDWGQITLDTHLGGGAYGDVFYGVEVSSGREVTVKWIRNVESDLEEYRVKNEAAIDVECEHIVPVISSKKLNPTTWIILFKYYKAQPLDAIIEESIGESVPHYKHYTEQLILALHAAHSNNIIHRDIKPGNILISDHSAATPGFLRVIDFGVSKLRAGESMTIPEVPVGTRPYMCPSVFVFGGKDATFGADIFSFGITVAEMVLGKHPWWTVDSKSIANQAELQVKSGQNSMVNIDLINAKDSSFTSLVEKSTAIETSGRIRQWSEIAKMIGLELDLPVLVLDRLELKDLLEQLVHKDLLVHKELDLLDHKVLMEILEPKEQLDLLEFKEIKDLKEVLVLLVRLLDLKDLVDLPELKVLLVLRELKEKLDLEELVLKFLGE